MAKSDVGVEAKPAPALAGHDFYKTNGLSRKETVWLPVGPSLTRQEFAEECDINAIMARYDAHIADPMRSVREPVYYDLVGAPGSLMEAMQVLKEGEEAFMRLPAAVRREFDNNAAAFVDFAADPANVGQMRDWGLAAPEKVADAPLRVQVVDPPGTPARAPAAVPEAPVGAEVPKGKAGGSALGGR